MAKRSRVLKRDPRYNAPASKCITYKRDEEGNVTELNEYTPKRKEDRRTKVVTLPNGELIVRITDL